MFDRYLLLCGINFLFFDLYELAKEKPLLTETQKKNRYIWAKSNLSWTKPNWDKVIYSGESRFDVCVGGLPKACDSGKNRSIP